MATKKRKTGRQVEAQKRQWRDYVQEYLKAKGAKQMLYDPERAGTSVSFTRYDKEDLLRYLQNPEQNEKNLRTASNHLFHASTHYRRLILFYSSLLLWKYILVPLNFDKDKAKKNKDAFVKGFLRAKTMVENMHIAQEFANAATIALREGIFYGVAVQSNNSFFLHKIDPELCKVTAKEDGCWLYAVDCSRIKEADLPTYPPEFTAMWQAYRSTNTKWVEVPSEICYCLKMDETNYRYHLPLFAGVLPAISDIENYKELQETSSNIANYKLLNMQIPLDKEDGRPLLDFALAKQYYDSLAAELPEYVGSAFSPMKIEAFDFPRTQMGADVDEVAKAEEHYWAASGTSSLLFGSAKNTSSSALKLSIQADEALMFLFMEQVERLINKHLKAQSGTMKFKIQFLPITRYNYKEMAELYQKAASYGLPTKAAYGAAAGVDASDLDGLNFLEMEVLGLGELIPLNNSFSGGATGNEGAGRKTDEENGDILEETGEQTQESGQNENKKA